MASRREDTAQQVAKAIVRGHVKLCVGITEIAEPYCSCAPIGSPLCEACAELATTIATALSSVTGCLNCGDANDGGYETEEVGPFCAQCWQYLEQHFTSTVEALRPKEPDVIYYPLHCAVTPPESWGYPHCSLPRGHEGSHRAYSGHIVSVKTLLCEWPTEPI